MIRVNDEYISNPFFETDPGLEPFILSIDKHGWGGPCRIALDG